MTSAHIDFWHVGSPASIPDSDVHLLDCSHVIAAGILVLMLTYLSFCVSDARSPANLRGETKGLRAARRRVPAGDALEGQADISNIYIYNATLSYSAHTHTQARVSPTHVKGVVVMLCRKTKTHTSAVKRPS